jgi:hypothetical protein
MSGQYDKTRGRAIRDIALKAAYHGTYHTAARLVEEYQLAFMDRKLIVSYMLVRRSSTRQHDYSHAAITVTNGSRWTARLTIKVADDDPMWHCEKTDFQGNTTVFSQGHDLEFAPGVEQIKSELKRRMINASTVTAIGIWLCKYGKETEFWFSGLGDQEAAGRHFDTDYTLFKLSDFD